MTDWQLTLFPPKLTERQQTVLDAVRRAHPDGLTADEAGAWAHTTGESDWRHGPDDRCRFCVGTGKDVLKALARKGLVRRRRATGSRPGGWVAVGEQDASPDASFGDFPEGF